jgi:ABC-type branched-subunit amino acid transport system ATPase component/ABC-type branched-subunit amino acid transport system permease subunit
MLFQLFHNQVTWQTFVSGVVYGLIYAALASGIVLLYRSTGVINFAQAEMGAFSAALVGLMVQRFGVPYLPAFALAVMAGVLVGIVVEATIVRRLFTSPRIVLFIATLGVGVLLRLAVTSLPDIANGGSFPLPFKMAKAWKITKGFELRERELIVLVLVPLLITGLGLLLTRTRLGLAMRSSADNPDTARLYGISAKRTSSVVWALSGGFAAVSAILTMPMKNVSASQLIAGTEGLSPDVLVLSLLVALLARLRSIPVTMYAGVVVGVAEQLIRKAVGRNTGVLYLIVFVAVLIVVLLLGRAKGSGIEEGGWTLSGRVNPIPEYLKSIWWVRHLNRIGLAALFGLAALVPLVVTTPSKLLLFTQIFIYAMIALSVTLLTGWAGQLSLGQFAFAGLGGLTMTGLYLGFPVPLIGHGYKLPWITATLIGTSVGALAALLVGLPALRVKGLMLAIVTLAFASMSSSWLLKQKFLSNGQSTLRSLPKPKLGPIDFSNRRSFYELCLVCLALAALLVAHLRKTGLGRSMIAVRENEEMAAASTVSGRRAKLTAFGVAGAIAALAGCLLVTSKSGFEPTGEAGFVPLGSISVLSMAIIGGLGSIAGAFLGALWLLGIPALFGYSKVVSLLTSGIGLLLLLMYLPGGLMQIVNSIRDQILGIARRRLPAEPPPTSRSLGTLPVRTIEPPEGQPWLSTRDVTVRFGGLTAVQDVNIQIDKGELVGLIGANGAGKSTLMNAISGFVASTGDIDVLGREVNDLSPRERHALGLGRGFQAAKLYPDLSVRDTVQVALEARKTSQLVPSLLALPPSPRVERTRRAEAAEIIDFLGLGRYADQLTVNLSTGTRRIVEFACLLAVAPKVILLDEPTGGVAQRETEAFGPLIRRLQKELGAAVLLIEHDMPLVMSVSDRIYCLEAGAVIAEGSPQAIRNDAKVIATYLGTDERAIERSDSLKKAPVVATTLATE